MIAKLTIRASNGEFTSNLLEIVNIKLQLFWIERQHITSHTTIVPADLNSTNHKVNKN